MAERTWPDDWEQRREGLDCDFCREGRVDENKWGVRFLATDFGDAYLQRSGPQPGYCVVIFRGRHACDVGQLDDNELLGYWQTVRAAARAIETVFSPCQLNYNLLGNAVPHLHTHVIARYPDDPAPGRPLPAEMWDNPTTIDPDLLRDHVAALAAACREIE